jgi:DHA2 family multidrug resistance protein
MAREGLARMGLTDVQSAAAITRQMVGQAYLLASTDLFRLSAWLCLALIILVWFTRRADPPQGPIAAD